MNTYVRQCIDERDGCKTEMQIYKQRIADL